MMSRPSTISGSRSAGYLKLASEGSEEVETSKMEAVHCRKPKSKEACLPILPETSPVARGKTVRGKPRSRASGSQGCIKISALGLRFPAPVPAQSNGCHRRNCREGSCQSKASVWPRAKLPSQQLLCRSMAPEEIHGLHQAGMSAQGSRQPGHRPRVLCLGPSLQQARALDLLHVKPKVLVQQQL